MKVIKNVLQEELQNARRQQAAYQKALHAFPKGSLVKKEIKGHLYYYLVFRDNGKVCLTYKGKLSREEVKKYADARKMREKYKKLLFQLKAQISFLQKALRAKEIRSVS